MNPDTQKSKNQAISKATSKAQKRKAKQPRDRKELSEQKLCAYMCT